MRLKIKVCEKFLKIFCKIKSRPKPYRSTKEKKYYFAFSHTVPSEKRGYPKYFLVKTKILLFKPTKHNKNQ